MFVMLNSQEGNEKKFMKGKFGTFSVAGNVDFMEMSIAITSPEPRKNTRIYTVQCTGCSIRILSFRGLFQSQHNNWVVCHPLPPPKSNTDTRNDGF